MKGNRLPVLPPFVALAYTPVRIVSSRDSCEPAAEACASEMCQADPRWAESFLSNSFIDKKKYAEKNGPRIAFSEADDYAYAQCGRNLGVNGALAVAGDDPPAPERGRPG